MPDLTYFETNVTKMTSDQNQKSSEDEIIPSRVETPEPIPDDCTCLECLLRPIQSMVRIFGVDFHFGEEGHEKPEREKKMHKWRKVYGIIILLFMWMAAGRQAGSFFMMNWKSKLYFGDISQILPKDGSSWLYVYLTSHWIACLSLTTFFFTDKTYYLTNLMYLLEEMRSDTARHRRIEKTILGWQKSLMFGTSLCFVGFTIYAVILFSYWRFKHMSPSDDKLLVAFQIFWACLEKIYLYGMGLYGPVFLVLNNLIVIKSYQEYAEQLSEEVNGDIQQTNFQALQIKYHRLCQMIGYNDQLMRGVSNFTFPGLIFMQALLFYLALFSLTLPASKIMIKILTFLTILIFAVACCYPAALTSAATRPYDVLYEATFMPIKVENQFRIHDLMKQIGGSPIGLTWLNVFVMNKGAIIKVISLLLSIFIFMLQFQQLHESRDCAAQEEREYQRDFIQD
ncbi:uncharacterized protein LOC111640508 isoform X1 [Centruroides sculpturatus]|uniref:uncharacterized protein LOC111640508 isoform X1 n=1 Tax=Centruroides sculpturatus TaxID=218467 RepID=UPI000C6D3A93|nr:uncharacterized protein LOC111640508 isoform X1 [Centruroides sculpturatus]